MAAVEPARKWGLENLTLHFASAQGAVYFAERDGKPVTLKLPASESWIKDNSAALLHFSDFGGVRVFAHTDSAVLMERVLPGTPLSSRVYEGQDEDATRVICDMAGRLHQAGPGEGFPPIPLWRPEFDQHDGGRGPISDDQYARAKAIYLELKDSQAELTLLHGDLHHDNILLDDARGWVVIDPKGWVGERAYEFGCMLRNPGTDPRLFADPKIIDRRVGIIAEQTGLDRSRLLGWAFSQAILSAIWSLDDNDDPARGLSAANAIEPLL